MSKYGKLIVYYSYKLHIFRFNINTKKSFGLSYMVLLFCIFNFYLYCLKKNKFVVIVTKKHKIFYDDPIKSVTLGAPKI